jgi:membrane protease YdiL (CAAX protease family)
MAVALAAVVRTIAGGTAPAASAPAAILFSAVLAGAAGWAGARFTHVSWTQVGAGVAGAAALVAVSLVGTPAVLIGPRATASALAWWVPLVAVVAATEELVLRGVLFDAVRTRSGDVLAVTATASLFAIIHLPLYGSQALAVDLCVGVFLGCLRVASGSVAAPLVAHVLADAATGWLG